MTRIAWKPVARTWLGIVAGFFVIVSFVALLAVFLHAWRITPAEDALVTALKEKAKADSEVQKVLLPELDRQQKVHAVRRVRYSRGGFALLVSGAIFLVWAQWLRPSRGSGAGAPAFLLRWLERPDARPAIRNSARHQTADDSSDRDARNPPAAPLIAARPMSPEDIDLGPVEEIIRSEGRGVESTVPILLAIQSHYRYLPEDALRRVCDVTDITPARITAVATFYEGFRHHPVGEHIIRVCEGTACHVAGAVEVRNEIRRQLGVPAGGDTDPAGLFTIERVACVGSCSLAPLITIDDSIYGHVSPLSAGSVIHGFLDQDHSSHEEWHGDGRRRSVPVAGDNPVEIRIGVGSCGLASGALHVQHALESETARLGGGAVIKSVGCSGLCHREPLVEVIENGRSALYGNVSPEEVRQIVRAHVQPRGFVRTVREGVADVRARLFDDAAWVPARSKQVDSTPFMEKQVRVVLENCGRIDPASLDEYRQQDGMRALEECLTHLSPQQVIDVVRTSGLRGRGGAGFLTAAKWDFARKAPGTKKYVICNGDEGDPGAFMDRAVLEGDPFRVLEGLAIAAYAVGADEGFVYVRREYPIAVRHIKAAIQSAEAEGLLGDHILGTAFSFKLHVREGAGAFVCGEETALIQSIEGQRGMPRPRPPYPAIAGLWGKPTVINNVETLACLPWIFRKGADAFAGMGTEKSKGTKVFSLAGKVNRGGLIEVAMGISIREIVEDIGGGIKGGKSFKAALLGGPSGGCLPARLADTRIDYEELASTGAIMGSGGLVVLDEHDCAVEIARYFLSFTQSESCGKCTYCRVGTRRMLEILERICAGHGREGDLDTLEELATRVKKGSLCGLGQTAPNPVLTTLRYFRDEYEAHIREGRCPAAQCKALIHYVVQDNCTGCTLCAQVCPAAAIDARPYERHLVIDDRCTRCGMCVSACLDNAIKVA